MNYKRTRNAAIIFFAYIAFSFFGCMYFIIKYVSISPFLVFALVAVILSYPVNRALKKYVNG